MYNNIYLSPNSHPNPNPDTNPHPNSHPNPNSNLNTIGNPKGSWMKLQFNTDLKVDYDEFAR